MLPYLESLVCALLFGISIGLERQIHKKSAGLRTNALVCLGSALFVLVGPLSGSDASRIEAQIVSGIGFIGGGAILREGLTVRGVSTAATLWCSAAVGSLCGAGKLTQAAIATVAILAANIALRPISHRMFGDVTELSDEETHYRLQFTCEKKEELRLRKLLVTTVEEMDLLLHSVRSEPLETGDRLEIIAVAAALKKSDHAVERVVAALSADPAINNVSWEIVHRRIDQD